VSAPAPAENASGDPRLRWVRAVGQACLLHQLHWTGRHPGASSPVAWVMLLVQEHAPPEKPFVWRAKRVGLDSAGRERTGFASSLEEAMGQAEDFATAAPRAARGG
jgi:hypothetical protein